VTFGIADYSSNASYEGYSPPLNTAVNPFNRWDDFQQELTRRVSSFKTGQIKNRFQEQLIRVAGPLFRTAAGEAALTLLAERRREEIPSHASLEKVERTQEPFRTIGADWATQTRAFYGELRVPLTGESLPFFRNLEVQLAVRNEALTAGFWTNAAGVEPLDRGARLRRRFQATSYTAGAKLTPWPWLMFRGSYATGEQPPPLVSLISFEGISNFQCFKDPKRGAETSCATYGILVKLGGSPDLEMARANTMSLGAVVAPLGERGPRISLDYSRIRRTGDPYMLTRDQILAIEDEWPERVVRMPLGEEDRARGYTGGLITTFDGRATNGRSRSVEALDGRFEWPTTVLDGRLRVYGAATLQLRNSTKTLFEPALETVGYRTGPLKWRANGGVDWDRRGTSIGANVQFFSKYRIIAADPLVQLRESQIPMFQGSSWVSSQAYLDVYASHRFNLRGAPVAQAVTVGFGLNNLLDTAPPFETRRAGGYGVSRYGDPRRRRLELTVSLNL
jgi:outer membrane receptor protein involved in Fe transport